MLTNVYFHNYVSTTIRYVAEDFTAGTLKTILWKNKKKQHLVYYMLLFAPIQIMFALIFYKVICDIT